MQSNIKLRDQYKLQFCQKNSEVAFMVNILELLTIFHEHLCFVLTANFVDHIDFYKFAKFLAFLELTWQVYKSLCSPRS